MLSVQLSDGPEIVIHDDVDEVQALYGTCDWLHGFDDRKLLQRIDISRDKYLVIFADPFSLLSAACIIHQAWEYKLADYFDGRTLYVAVGDGKQLSVEAEDFVGKG